MLNLDVLLFHSFQEAFNLQCPVPCMSHPPCVTSRFPIQWPFLSKDSAKSCKPSHPCHIYAAPYLSPQEGHHCQRERREDFPILALMPLTIPPFPASHICALKGRDNNSRSCKVVKKYLNCLQNHKSEGEN